MKLEHHDDKVNDPIKNPKQSAPTHCATSEMDYDYQAEQWVIDSTKDHPWEVKWILIDELGPRAIWERRANGTELVAKADRFTGECKPADNCLVLP